MPPEAEVEDGKTCQIRQVFIKNTRKPSDEELYYNILYDFSQIEESAPIKNPIELICFLPILRVTMSNQLSSLTTVQLRRAADLKEKIEALNKELNTLLGGSASPSIKAPAKKGGMSAAGRAKIAAAQKARWAKAKPAAKPAVKVVAKRGGMSAAVRAKIASAAKARWAKVKAAGKNTL